MEACITSSDWFKTSIHFFTQFFFGWGMWCIFWQFLQFFSPVIFEFLAQSWLVVLWKKSEITKYQLLLQLRYIKPRGKKKTRNSWAVIYPMQWLILSSQKCYDVLKEWQLLPWKKKRWSSSRSSWTKYKKWIVSKQNE